MIIALDPGGTTGWASYSLAYQSFEWGQLNSEHHQQLYDFLTRLMPECVITESFEYRNVNRPGLVLASVEYIGVAKLWNQRYNKTMVFQTASMAKGFVKDEHLKRLDLWSPGKPHAMDAMRHLLYYLVKETLLRSELLRRGWKEN